MKYLAVLIIAAAIALLLPLERPDSNPPGINPGRFDFPTEEELDSIWQAEVRKSPPHRK